MYIGTFQQGDWIPIPLLTGTAWPLDSSGVRTIPTLTVINESQDLVLRDEEVPPAGLTTGMHALIRQATAEFSVGRYVGIIKWNTGGVSNNRHELVTFTVVAGGNPVGALVGLHFYRGPNADYLLTMSDSGTIESRKGPQV
jgi:hypothetical protein